MTLSEAIKHCEEVAEKNDNIADTFEETLKNKIACRECASEHRQLAEWLRELKMYREIFEKVGKTLADNGYTMDDLDTILGKEKKGAKVNDK